MQLQITRPFLWFPVQIGAGRERVIIETTEGARIAEFEIPLSRERVDYYAAADLSAFTGTAIRIHPDLSSTGVGALVEADTRPEPRAERRPLAHFTPSAGWMNDPNGLVLRDGVFHLYFQYNPYDVKWGNMHWGHAVSRDLVHWKERPIALYPDDSGTVFSGSCFEDKRNDAGFGWNTLLFYYTAAGGTNTWSAGKKFTQRLAISRDGGETLVRTDGDILETIERENRDPKIFYHRETKAYIMVLFLDNNDFAILRSGDLVHFRQTQRLTLPGAWECPDLFELPVEGEDTRMWVFWSADGYYFCGDFDGFRFVPKYPRRAAYAGGVPYAAQTFSGVGERLISVPWHRISPENKTYAGIMGLASELTLRNLPDGPIVAQRLPAEILAALFPIDSRTMDGTCRYGPVPTGDAAYLIRVAFSPDSTGDARVVFGSHTCIVDLDRRRLGLSPDEEYDLPPGPLDLQIVVDTDVLEVRACDGTFFLAGPNADATLRGEVSVNYAGVGSWSAAVSEFR